MDSSPVKRITWDEYANVISGVVQKLRKYLVENDTKIDVVVPILRGAATFGAFLAYKFDVELMTPVQYRFYIENNKIRLKRLFDIGIYKKIIPKCPTFLLAENNHCYGVTAHYAAKDIKQYFSTSRILYAADYMDYSHATNDYAEAVFYGKLTNESRDLSEAACRSKEIECRDYLFPWEDNDEEHFRYAYIKRKLDAKDIKLEA